eukprot:scaffold1135_cov216-Pinguiococcus_pyrenoidosus.AAC.8
MIALNPVSPSYRVLEALERVGILHHLHQHDGGGVAAFRSLLQQHVDSRDALGQRTSGGKHRRGFQHGTQLLFGHVKNHMSAYLWGRGAGRRRLQLRNASDGVEPPSCAAPEAPKLGHCSCGGCTTAQ